MSQNSAKLSVENLEETLERGRVEELNSFEVLDTPPEDSFDNITRLAQTALGTPIVLVSLVDKERQWFKSRQGLDAEETPRDISFCTHAIKDEDVFVVENAIEHPMFHSNPLVTGDPNIRFYAGAPLKTVRGYLIGTLCAIDTAPRGLSISEKQILVELASLVVRELELRKIATLDGLTGAMAHSNYLRMCNKEFARTKRLGHKASLLALDLDHFKKINDTYGHPAGDRVLKEVAAACMSQLRENDLFGRIGGEEFAILLPDTELAPALQIAERTRACIESLDIIWEGQKIPVTASVGVTAVQAQDQEMKQVISRADSALYDAKNAGRNRVQSRS